MIFVQICEENAEEIGIVSFIEYFKYSISRYGLFLFQSRTVEVEKAKFKNEI